MNERARTAVLVLVVGLLAACTTDIAGQASSTRNTSTGGNPVDTPLQDRPSSDDAAAELEQMSAEIRAAISALAPSIEWTAGTEQGASGCGGQDSGQGGRTVFLPTWAASGGIPDATWPAAQSAVEQIAGGYGFDPFIAVVDRVDDHFVEAAGPYGAALQLGTKVDAVVSIRTGCHPG